MGIRQEPVTSMTEQIIAGGDVHYRPSSSVSVRLFGISVDRNVRRSQVALDKLNVKEVKDGDARVVRGLMQ